MMEYKSPLENCYDEESNPNRFGRCYGPSKNLRKEKVSVGPDNGNKGQRNHPYQPKYSDRHKPNSYPRELTDLFGALECKLCGLEVSSCIVARTHYNGKQHMKNIKTYLLDWSCRTGNPLPETDPSRPSLYAQSLADYCEICDLKLSSVNDKLLHYSGKHHRKNELDPMNAKKRKRKSETVDNTGRFGIGTDFSPAVTEENIVSEKYPNFKCNLCNVQAVSQEQLQIHLVGKKHNDKLKKKESGIPKRGKQFPCDLCGISLDTEKLYMLHIQGQKHQKKLLKQNPQILCEVCKLDFNSSDQYQIHIKGKKHEKKIKQMCDSRIGLNNEPVSLTCKYCPFVGNILNHQCDGSLKKTNDNDVNGKLVCVPCHNMVFDNEQQYNDHMTSQRHMMCMLNTEDRDRVVDDFIYCKLCSKQCLSYKDYTEHLLGEDHISKAKEIDLCTTDIFYCSVCEINMDKKTKEEHMRDKVHLMKALLMDTKQTLTSMANNVSVTTTSFHCSNCNVTLKSFVKYSEHLLSQDHADRLIREKLRLG